MLHALLVILGSATRLKNASLSKSSKYCSSTSVPYGTFPPAITYASFFAIFKSCSEIYPEEALLLHQEAMSHIPFPQRQEFSYESVVYSLFH